MGFADRYLHSVFLEGGDHEGYYQKYASSSKGLTEEEFNKLIVKNNLFHEIGHLFDSYGVFLSHFDDFINIFDEEMNNFMHTRTFLVANFQVKENINIPIEYFASSFACFILYPEDLQQYCPKTYKYMDEFVRGIESRVNSYYTRN